MEKGKSSGEGWERKEGKWIGSENDDDVICICTNSMIHMYKMNVIFMHKNISSEENIKF